MAMSGNQFQALRADPQNAIGAQVKPKFISLPKADPIWGAPIDAANAPANLTRQKGGSNGG